MEYLISGLSASIRYDNAIMFCHVHTDVLDCCVSVFFFGLKASRYPQSGMRSLYLPNEDCVVIELRLMKVDGHDDEKCATNFQVSLSVSHLSILTLFIADQSLNSFH